MRHALPLAAAGFVFAWIGSIIAVGLDPDAMRIGFAIFMLVLATYVYLQMYLRKPPPSTELRHPWPWLIVLGSGSGILGGFFGLGASVLATPILSTVFGATQVVAQGLSLALAVPSTGVTLLTYALHNHIDWHIGIPMVLGGLLSVSWGVRLAHTLPEKSLRTWFCLFLVFCAALMIFKA
ncbi:putative membrane protein YfcA [Pseudomonas synxantha]|uniref:Membrane protein YfcA n=1 Tax=Pseudomonas synxantha TaxID=47883 RepID=A0ACC6JKY5_9PSED|nr:putative membrane protein YfcA [Pseudomonas synxantha]